MTYKLTPREREKRLERALSAAFDWIVADVMNDVKAEGMPANDLYSDEYKADLADLRWAYRELKK